MLSDFSGRNYIYQGIYFIVPAYVNFQVVIILINVFISQPQCMDRQSSLELWIEQNVCVFSAYISLTNGVYFVIINLVPVVLVVHKGSIMPYFFLRTLTGGEVIMVSYCKQPILWLYFTKGVRRLLVINIWV